MGDPLGMAWYEDQDNLTCVFFFQKRLPVRDPFLFGKFDLGFLSSESLGNLHDPGFVGRKGSLLCARQGWFFMQ